MSVKFTPTGDNVIVEREQIKEEGGVALPEQSWTYKMWGLVIAVGPGMLRQIPKSIPGTYDSCSTYQQDDHLPMQVKVGDLVLCPQNMYPIPKDPFNQQKRELLFYCREGLLTILHSDTNGHSKK